MSTVRENLLSVTGYEPYCGNFKCRITPRCSFNGEQFECHCCGWKSDFEDDFIEKYKAFQARKAR